MYIIFSILKRTKRKHFKLQRDFHYTVSGKRAYSSVLLDHCHHKGHGFFSSLGSGTFNPPHSCPLPQGGKLKPGLCGLCWDSRRESCSGRKNVPSFHLPDPHKKIPALCVNPLLPKPPNQKSGMVSILFVQARGPFPLSKDQQEV